jgi:hypothetical protein
MGWIIPEVFVQCKIFNQPWHNPSPPPRKRQYIPLKQYGETVAIKNSARSINVK